MLVCGPANGSPPLEARWTKGLRVTNGSLLGEEEVEEFKLKEER